MISTKGKFKISKELSWPVNAKMISEGLEHVPQYGKLGIYFFDCSTTFKSEFKKRVQKKEEIDVLSVNYRNEKPHWSTAKYLIERGWYNETWEITVYPVPRDRKREVREAICRFGFYAIRKWLTKRRPPIWYDGRKFLILSYNLDNGELLFRES